MRHVIFAPSFLVGLFAPVLLVVALLILSASNANANEASEVNEASDFNNSWNLCAQATQTVESRNKLPHKILLSISLAESGRRDDLNKSVVAWPWTVTSGSREWYLDSKELAIEQTRTLLRTGIRNIDVGCMQINLRYHGKKFKNIYEIFDPLKNVSYAAEYLKKMRKNTPDWMTAVGNYHSTTPEFHNRYRLRVAEIWENQRGTNRSSTPYNVTNLGAVSGTVPIDHSRTNQLNNAFKNRVSITDSVGGEGGIGSVGGDTWKSTYMQAISTGESYLLQAQINRIRKSASETVRINTLLEEERNQTALKHKNDLNNWRTLYNITLNAPPSETHVETSTETPFIIPE